MTTDSNEIVYEPFVLSITARIWSGSVILKTLTRKQTLRVIKPKLVFSDVLTNENTNMFSTDIGTCFLVQKIHLRPSNVHFGDYAIYESSCLATVSGCFESLDVPTRLHIPNEDLIFFGRSAEGARFALSDSVYHFITRQKFCAIFEEYYLAKGVERGQFQWNIPWNCKVLIAGEEHSTVFAYIKQRFNLTIEKVEDMENGNKTITTTSFTSKNGASSKRTQAITVTPADFQ